MSRLDNLFYPVIYLMNRPAFAALNRLILFFALRINGMGIAWSGACRIGANEERFLRRFRARIDGGLVLDVGANTGDYALAVRSLCPRSRIISFEPQPRTFERFLKACAGQDIELEKKALGEVAGRTVLYELEGKESSTVASLSAATLELYGRVGEGYDVEVTTLDDFCEQRGILSVRLLKIDAEGYDLFVLKGGNRLISQRKIDIIEFEIIPANIKTDVHFYQFVEVLKGYQLFRLCLNGGLLPLLPYDWRMTELYMTYHVIAIRKGFDIF